jgi:predicted GIY-YIG superfamily endonuclease
VHAVPAQADTRRDSLNAPSQRRTPSLVWFDEHPSGDLAFRRERQVKERNRVWKLGLIERMNPNSRAPTSELEWRLAE